MFKFFTEIKIQKGDLDQSIMSAYGIIQIEGLYCKCNIYSHLHITSVITARK